MGVVCGAAAASGHGFGGGWEVERGEKWPFFAFLTNSALDLIFNAVLAVEDVSFVKKSVRPILRL